MSPSILVVEDELPMRRVLRAAIGGQGYRVWEAGTVAEGLASLAAHAPQVVLLDLGLPDGDGCEFVLRARESSQVPIVVISARGGEMDQVRALDVGANDYVTKPFREAELLARVRAAIRTSARTSPGGGNLTIGPLSIHPVDRKVFLAGREVSVTPTEFSLLHVMAREVGRVVTHRHLLREVWGHSALDDVQYLRVYMTQLRKKLEQDPAKPQLLVTAPGVGYRLKAPD